jgi:hypothetical protein
VLAEAGDVEHGRVFLPLRETFEALYSTVYYDQGHRIVVARNMLHVMQLRVESRIALLDGRVRILDSAPHLIRGTVYVPLRFAAEAMGAIVRYNARAETVAVNGSDETARPPADIAHPPQDLTPPPDSTVVTAYPVVSASLAGLTAATNAVRLTIDGRDVTPQASFDGRTVTYVPQAGLAPGRHTAGFYGHGVSGQAFVTQWSFVTSAPPTDTAATYGYAPYQFYATPEQPYAGGTWMNLTLVGPPNGSGFVQFCSPNIIYPLWNGGGRFYRARIAFPGFYVSSGCPINAVFIDGSGRRLVITPLSNGMYLTGNPLHPIGQYPAAPTIVPILPPFIH